jgi:4'-phosphopantetheinyl transferase
MLTSNAAHPAMAAFDAGRPAGARSGRVPQVFTCDAPLDPLAPFDFICPPIAGIGVICIGLSIRQTDHHNLRTHALRRTTHAEQYHASRFLKPMDGLRHLVGRALLRRLGAQFGGTSGLEPLHARPWGKPVFRGARFDVNLSHAGSQVWGALSLVGDVGIDVESSSMSGEPGDVFAGFHPREIGAIVAASDPRHATLRCWTRKESVAKATGMGLSLPLTSYAVDCDDTITDWLCVPPPGTDVADWTVVDLPAADDYFAALAVHGRCEQVSVLRVCSSSPDARGH